MKKIVFLGSNPPNKSKTLEPFQNCRSGEVLKKWLDYLNLPKELVILKNVANYTTENNRKLTRAEIKAEQPRLEQELKDCIVIALGSTAFRAAIAVKRAIIFEKEVLHCFLLPHPSPLNRKLNAYEDGIPKDLLDNLRKDILFILASSI